MDYIEQDLEQLKVMFLADGQGLPPQEIEDLCKPVVELLTVLQLETGILIKNFKDVSCHCCSPRVQLKCSHCECVLAFRTKIGQT